MLPDSGQSNAGNDTFYGLGGNDALTGGAGADRIDGGSGTDTASYAGSNAAVNVNLQTGTGSGGHATGDTLVSIENLTGSSYNDTLTGNSGNNVLDGGAGADTMRGGAGDDTYVVDNAGRHRRRKRGRVQRLRYRADLDQLQPGRHHARFG